MKVSRQQDGTSVIEDLTEEDLPEPDESLREVVALFSDVAPSVEAVRALQVRHFTASSRHDE